MCISVQLSFDLTDTVKNAHFVDMLQCRAAKVTEKNNLQLHKLGGDTVTHFQRNLITVTQEI